MTNKSELEKKILNLVNEFNSKNLTISEIWNDPKYQEYRNIHLNGKRKKLYPCNRCVAK